MKSKSVSAVIQWRILLCAAVLLACVPRPAHADGFAHLGLGVSFGSPSAQGRPNVIAGVGWLSREPIGVELDVGYAPRFFKNSGSFTENRLTTVMGNVIVAGFDRSGGRFARRRRGVALRPYVSGGFGLMSETVDSPSGGVSNHHLGVNAGVGVMALPRDAFGLRAEVRYFQDLVGAQVGNTTVIDLGSFHFWRASIGVVVRF